MIRAVVLRPEAEAEVVSAQHWYEAQRPGLGARFARALENAVDNVATTPESYPRVHGDVRRAFVQEFPYAIYFRLHQDTAVILAVILAVMHGRRDPRRWQSR